LAGLALLLDGAATFIRADRSGERDRSFDRARGCSRHGDRVWRLRVSELQAGSPGGQAAPAPFRGTHAVRLSPFSPGRGPPPRIARRGGGGGCRRARQVLADARYAVREPAASKAPPAARLRRAARPRSGALRCRDGRAGLLAEDSRAHAERARQRSSPYADLLRRSAHPGRLVRPGLSVQGCGIGAAKPAFLTARVFPQTLTVGLAGAVRSSYCCAREHSTFISAHTRSTLFMTSAAASGWLPLCAEVMSR